MKPSTFFEEPYDEVDQYHDFIWGYCETMDYEFLSDEELEALERSVWE